ncbi:flagellar basal-body MS-ring/collar protein FliF [Neobacillus niacini]|uniref:flagellar basal-body MS-ring/collar protein FliF n=1 Tax=Neobacillus niacini TaxID=86668 RepID=UPI002040D51B|nr:flagellar basal-body MS-ring/collar protein FliF [Neobacillus niacini]MCM3693277.1 flagellar M-ring protein FliF [Neobacillus niacini]
MNQQIREQKEKISGYWNSVSKKNKILYSGLFLFIIVALSFTIYFVSKPTYVPLFNNELSQQEIGDVKAELDRQGVTDYKLENNGTTISVPAEEASNLLVSLAAKGLPKTGTISFSEMTKDLKFGATDRQLDAMEREALQGQVESLLTHVSGVKSAQVVVSTPEESLFVRPDEKGQATASVVVELEPGVDLTPKQIQTLYHLVSKSIPNLPKENIIMTDQGGQGLDDTSQDELLSENYNKQRKIQNDVETDIQKDLQQMLGTIMGHDKVMIQTFVRLNFDQVQTEENLVEPVNEETNEGIVISAEEISKTYNGQENPTGVAGTGETDVPSYAAEGTAQESTSEELENRVNYEVNRINRNIVQSPYKIDDVTINVGVEPPDPENPDSLTDETIANIEQILSNVVRTALSGNPELTDENVASRITVFPREFSGRPAVEPNEEEQQMEMSSWWMYALIGAGALLAIVILTIFFVSRRRRKLAEEEEDLEPFPLLPPRDTRSKEEIDIQEEKAAIKKEIEQMAQHQPEVFVGLLRNWLTKD